MSLLSITIILFGSSSWRKEEKKSKKFKEKRSGKIIMFTSKNPREAVEKCGRQEEIQLEGQVRKWHTKTPGPPMYKQQAVRSLQQPTPIQ